MRWGKDGFQRPAQHISLVNECLSQIERLLHSLHNILKANDINLGLEFDTIAISGLL
jgi:hypothetical protein